ncbi:MAG: methyltransferase domain-containing protein [Chloroflexi bacterium]|nr:methyltransferase domain-containing protein [Chloroflexota bacterium]
MKNGPATARKTQAHFGRQARLYAQSDAHRAGDSLETIARYAARGRFDTAVDLGTGAGFTAFAIAPYARSVLATDIAPAMLSEARRLATERNLANVGFLATEAEHLPFAASTLDVIACRHAAHHFHDLPMAVQEVHRTIRTNGSFLLADTIAPEGEYEAAWMNDVEVRRDSTHQRNLRASEWRSLLNKAGFAITHSSVVKVNLEFNDWVQRAATSQGEVDVLRRDFLAAPPSVRAAFGIQGNGNVINFYWSVLALRAVKQTRRS